MLYRYTSTGIFGDAYGSGNYNSSTYSSSSSSSTTSEGSDPTSGGLLTNTGFDVVLAISLACLIIFVALIVRFWKRPAKSSAVQSVKVDADH